MLKVMWEKVAQKTFFEYELTLYQTEQFGDKKGYQLVHRDTIFGSTHDFALEVLYKMLNVQDSIPVDYKGRYVSTGDIVQIDEGRKGSSFYRLEVGGWNRINRIHLR
ncbi:YodL domain-containing protein [Bacillus coahuilensis]|uniref:YodL domain-containing protein n=1 Tax=Bacillus coahuilensis TaxID=408580 RepID=UPI0001850C38|nr:YodL domain-containing protein [Bacillus coahuilensis]